MRTIKKLSLVFILVLMTLLMASCGANISTRMIVDGNFVGQRIIDVKIDNSDMADNVVGGFDALKNVAETNLPEELTLSVTSDTSSSTLVFTMSFNGIDDYRTKVASLISKGSNTELVPEIIYENEGTYFKKGIRFEENFTSFDLLCWYFDALKTAGIITHEDSSDWYEMGGNSFTMDDVEYRTYGNEYGVEERELNCLESIYVDTYPDLDGSCKRVFTFHASEYVLEKLADKGCVLKDYLKNLTPQGDVFEENTESGYGGEYIITVTAKDAAELVQKTNAILQTENSFALDIQLDEENAGMANVTVKEKLDGSYYLNYDYNNPIYNKIHLFNNTTYSGSKNEGRGDFYDGTFSTYPSLEENEYYFKWKIGFASVALELDVDSAEEASVTLIFKAEEKLSEAIRNAAFSAMETRCGASGSCEKEDNVLRITFSGLVAEVNAKINAFVKPASEDGENDDDADYFTLQVAEAETGSGFSTSLIGEVNYDFTPLIGNGSVIINPSEGAVTSYYYDGSHTVDEEENHLYSSVASADFTVVKTSIISIILCAVFVLVFVLGAALLFINRQTVVELVKEMKAKSAAKAEAAKAAAAAQPAAAPAPAPTYVETPAVQTAPTQEVPPAAPQETKEEETEDLL